MWWALLIAALAGIAVAVYAVADSAALLWLPGFRGFRRIVDFWIAGYVEGLVVGAMLAAGVLAVAMTIFEGIGLPSEVRRTKLLVDCSDAIDLLLDQYERAPELPASTENESIRRFIAQRWHERIERSAECPRGKSR